MKNQIKSYCEEQKKTDPAFAEVYNEQKLDECVSYLFTQAKKLAKNNCACVQDSVVYKWVRDFYFGDVAEETKAEENENLDIAENEELEVKPATVITKRKEKQSDEQHQLNLFD